MVQFLFVKKQYKFNGLLIEINKIIDSIKDQTRSMNSPFINQIAECKKRMRKLRKKIYKHNINQNDRKTWNKSQDISSILINIFEKRKLPQAVICSLKNKRNIDIFSLKSLVIGNQSSLKWDIQTLHSKTSSQEEQTSLLYRQHCQRMHQLKKIQTPRFSRRALAQNYVSSTQGDFSSLSDNNESQDNSCSEFKQYSEPQNMYNHDFENSIDEDIFSEVLLGRQETHCKVEAHAFNCFEMGQGSILSGQNIFNF